MEIEEVVEGVLRQGPKDWGNNTIRNLHNSSVDTKAEFNNCFIIYSKCVQHVYREVVVYVQ